MSDFLVTSIGRTGTKWLANVLGVPHEPAKFTGQAVSPRHLYMMTTGMWQPPKDCKIVVMVREPRAQLLSIINRAEAVGKEKLTLFRNMLGRYLETLNGLVREGAQVIQYELVVGDRQGVNTLADSLGIKIYEEFFNQKFNLFPNKVKKLPPWCEKVITKLSLYYNSWTEGFAYDVPIKEPDPTRHQISYGGRHYQMDYVFPAEIAALRAHRSGQFQEVPVLEWLKTQARVGTYMDIGAHIGNHSLFFLEHCPSTRVISIEAHPQIYALLKGNIERNSSRSGDWLGLNKAAWFESGAQVGVAPIPHNNAGHTHLVNSGGRHGERAHVQVLTLALNALGGIGEVAVLKIDVEDVEEEVIIGATNILRYHHPILIAERHNKKQLDEFEKLIKPFKYKRAAEWKGIHTYAWV